MSETSILIVDDSRSIRAALEAMLRNLGVSDPADLQMLDRLGIDVIQGFLFCRPKTIAEVSCCYKLWRKTYQPRTPGQLLEQAVNKFHQR